MTLEHLALNVPDPTAAAAWYAENLGLRVAKVIPGAPLSTSWPTMVAA